MKIIKLLSITVLFIILVACNNHATRKFIPSDFQETTESFYSISDDSLMLLAAQDSSNVWLSVRSYYIKGNVYQQDYKFLEAMNNYLESLHLLDNYFDDSDNLVNLMYGLIYSQISDVFYRSEYLNMARQAALSGLEYVQSANDSIQIARMYWKLADIYDVKAKSFENDTAIYYLNLGWKYVNEEDNPYESALLLSQYADCMRHNRQRDSAYYYFRRSIELTPEGDDLLYKNYLHLGYVYFLDNNLDSALMYVSKAYEETEHFPTKYSAVWGLADIYQRIGDTENAARFSSYQRDYQVKVDLAKKHDSEIISLYEDYQKHRKNKADTGFVFIAVIAIVMVAFIVVYVIVKQRRQKTEQDKLDSNSDVCNKELVQQRRQQFMETDIYKTIINRCPKKMTPEHLRSYKNKLTTNEWNELFKAIDICFDGYRDTLQDNYKSLSSAELEYCYLSLFNISETNKAALLGISYSGAGSRRLRAAEAFQCSTKELNSMLNHLLEKSIK